MHRPISRRTLLRGLGVSLALPWLESMSPAIQAAGNLSEPPLRAGFLFMPNGVRPAHWKATGEGEDFEIKPLLKPLEKHKNDFCLLDNLWHKNTVGRNGHWPKVPAYLRGGFVVRTSGSDMDTGGASLDQVLAGKIGDRTPLPSFELGVDAARTGVDNIGGGFTRIYGSHIAWRDAHTPVPKEIIPQLAFDRLFRTGSSGPVLSGFDPKQAKVIKSLQRDEQSLLDLVSEDAASLKNKISKNDQAKLDEYLASVRSIENRIEASMKPQKRWINEGNFDLARPAPGIPEDHQEHVRLMLDIMLLSFWTDTTRVCTFMFGNAQTGRNFGFIDGVKGSFHQLSHHRNEDKMLVQYEKIVHWHMEQMDYLIGRMKSIDEGGTSLLDNSMMLFGSTIKDGNSHDPHDLPLLLAGRAKGAIRSGRRITAKKDTPLCNLYVWMQNQFGIDTKSYGDSNGIMEGLS